MAAAVKRRPWLPGKPAARLLTGQDRPRARPARSSHPPAVVTPAFSSSRRTSASAWCRAQMITASLVAVAASLKPTALRSWTPRTPPATPRCALRLGDLSDGHDLRATSTPVPAQRQGETKCRCQVDAELPMQLALGDASRRCGKMIEPWMSTAGARMAIWRRGYPDGAARSRPVRGGLPVRLRQRGRSGGCALSADLDAAPLNH